MNLSAAPNYCERGPFQVSLCSARSRSSLVFISNFEGRHSHPLSQLITNEPPARHPQPQPQSRCPLRSLAR